jgi:hypothetical protein
MRLRRQIVRAFIRHEKSWIATHFQMKEQRVEPQCRLQELEKSFALCCVEPLCNASEIVSSTLRGTTGHE